LRRFSPRRTGTILSTLMTQPTTKVVFWGVRGSTPTAQPNAWRYGGNTACVEVISSNGARFVLDCGTGLRLLGNEWEQSGFGRSIEAHVLVTHYHWDHIQGIPFFPPFSQSRNKFHLYGFQSKFVGPDSLHKVFDAQLASPYFPVGASAMASAREFHEIDGGERFEINGTYISTCWLNHPQGCLAYRLNTEAGSVVYATDNEPGVPEFDENLRQIASGADVLICDSQYSPEQLATTRKGWGHSSWLECVKIARQARVRNLVLFHHDPDSTDGVIDGFLYAARQEFPSTWAAMEGMSATIQKNSTEVAMASSRIAQRQRVHVEATVSGVSDTGGRFEEKAIIRDINFQGAYIALEHRPALQSQIAVTLPLPGAPGAETLALRGTVTRADASLHESKIGVAVVFAEDEDRIRARD
jgi:phosphoribosyl 1,2-cyclic phosphodiesterase